VAAAAVVTANVNAADVPLRILALSSFLVESPLVSSGGLFSFRWLFRDASSVQIIT